MPTPEEELLTVIRKKESNKQCANCNELNKFGHQNICEKYKTFVCSMCKSAHQSFSHRVKSVTMSNWSMAEVEALKDENGGGNNAARAEWLGLWNADKMRKPKSGDSLDYYKSFIQAVYNDKKFYCAAQSSRKDHYASESGSESDASWHEKEKEMTKRKSSARRQESSVPQVVPESIPQSSAPAVDLLDMSSPTFSSSNPASDQVHHKSGAASFDPFGMSSLSLPPAPAAQNHINQPTQQHQWSVNNGGMRHQSSLPNYSCQTQQNPMGLNAPNHMLNNGARSNSAGVMNGCGPAPNLASGGFYGNSMQQNMAGPSPNMGRGPMTMNTTPLGMNTGSMGMGSMGMGSMGMGSMGMASNGMGNFNRSMSNNGMQPGNIMNGQRSMQGVPMRGMPMQQQAPAQYYQTQYHSNDPFAGL